MSTGRLMTENFALSATLSGGAWRSELPLANLIDDRLISHPARSTGALKTQFAMELSRIRPVDFIGLFVTNLSATAKIRVRVAADTDPEKATLDTGWQPVFARFHASLSLPWEAPNFWNGGPLAEDLELYGRHKLITLPRPQLARHVVVDIEDLTNPDGYIDLGYLYVGQAHKTQFNFSRGRNVSVQSRSRRALTTSGHPFFDRKRGQRVQTISYGYLDDDELASFLDMSLRNDLADPVVFIPDPDDPVSVMRGAFLGRFRQMPGALYRLPGGNQSRFQIEEVMT